MRPTTVERRQRHRIAVHQRRIGIACIAVSVASILYMAAELVRAALS